MTSYRAPWWLPGGHAQTIYAALLAPRPRVVYRRERWDTPDGDFIDLDWLDAPSAAGSDSYKPQATSSKPLEAFSLKLETGGRPQSTPDSRPLVALFHGLEGSSRSHYSLALMAALCERGMRGVAVHFRGCSGEPNRLSRAYHSGDAQEIDWILRRLRADAPILHAVGISLGGNALLKWLGESGASAREVVNRAASVSAPLDLTAAGNALDQGFNRVYARHFLSSMKRKALAKLAHYPGLLDAARLRAACTLRDFDDCVTAPLHGFKDVNDYWTRASAKPWLRRIAVPTLLINARNDPFLPAIALPAPDQVSSAVTLEYPDDGGHVGFVTGPLPGRTDWLPRRVLQFIGA